MSFGIGDKVSAWVRSNDHLERHLPCYEEFWVSGISSQVIQGTTCRTYILRDESGKDYEREFFAPAMNLLEKATPFCYPPDNIDENVAIYYGSKVNASLIGHKDDGGNIDYTFDLWSDDGTVSLLEGSQHMNEAWEAWLKANGEV